LNSKIKPNQIKDIIEGLKTEHLEKETDKLILIIKPKPNSTILKIIKEKEYRFVEIFWLNNVVFNITKHVLVPKHIKITEEEIKLVMEKHYIVTKSIFPVMNRDDPIARYLNLSSGDVCKIIRKSPTSGEYISYRVVK
jgi:DNA-directed RNA polymerase I, II, and III subunit RPABC1